MDYGQSALPPTRPTALPASAGGTGATMAARTARPAEIVYEHGTLRVAANGASLDQILVEIARLTGMKISGGVVDQGVYGTYGPAAPEEVLNELLEGSGCNVLLLRKPDSPAPVELILTPQAGGAAPPSLNAAGSRLPERRQPVEERPANREPAEPERPAERIEQPAGAEQSPAGETTSAAGTPGPEVGDAAASTGTPASGSNPSSPNGVLTPQEIYQQLQQLQKAPPKQ